MLKRRLIQATAVVGFALLLIFPGLLIRAKPVPVHPFFERLEEQVGADGVAVIAHQGGEWLWPSNTMLAFQNAVTLGVDVLEMDVHATADGVLVVMHDDTVDRTTDGSGAIKEMTFAKLQTLDAGYYWTEDDQNFLFRGQGIRVPALEELFVAFPHMLMNIEIKQREPSIAADLCEMLRDYGMTQQTLVASFHPEAMTEFRAVCPEVATSMVEPEIRQLYTLQMVGLGAFFAPPAQAIQVPEFSGDTHVLTDRFVTAAQRKNVAVHAWTINDVETMQRLLNAGVVGLITDRPDLALSLVAVE